jgi:epoxyqueuosine reductase
MTGEALLQRLSDAGFHARLVPVAVLDGMKQVFDRLDKDSPVFKRYPFILNFSPPGSLPDAKSILVVAGRSPAVRIYFTFEDGVRPFIIPPTYLGMDLREGAQDIINSAHADTDYEAERATVPLKLLSVMSGLARYGRNNITFYPGLGSYVHLQAFFTTLPPVHQPVEEPLIAEECASCNICMKACPTGAITDAQFVIRHEKCLTFCNEDTGPFPGFIGDSAHHCLVGCMRCQQVCPMNKINKDFSVDGLIFDAAETAHILSHAPLESLAPHTVEKLDKITFKNDYDILPRNLQALVK